MANENTQTHMEKSNTVDRHGMDQAIENASGKGGAQEMQKGSEGIPSDDSESAGEIYSNNLMSRAEAEVRANEDASLQDDTETFDLDNTDGVEIHDVGDEFDFSGDGDYIDMDNDDDFIQ